MEIKQIQLVFENCESIEIDRKYIGDLKIDNIKESICRVASNSISSFKTCKVFLLSVNHLADTKQSIKRLLQYNDITSVIVLFEDGSKDSFRVKWNYDDSQYNRYQETYRNKYGDIFVVISKKLNLRDFYNEEDMDNFEWNWCE